VERLTEVHEDGGRSMEKYAPQQASTVSNVSCSIAEGKYPLALALGKSRRHHPSILGVVDVTDRGLKRAFDEPIMLPGGGKLVTLLDCTNLRNQAAKERVRNG